MADSLGGIITNGMGSDHNAMILGPFHLKIDTGIIPPPPGNGGGPGGAGGAFDADDIYRVDEEPKKRVNISVKMGNTIIEKTYVVSTQRSDKIVKLVSWTNETLRNIHIGVSKFKRKMASITVKFKSNDDK